MYRLFFSLLALISQYALSAQQVYVVKLPGYTGYALPYEKGIEFDEIRGSLNWSNDEIVLEYNLRIPTKGEAGIRLMASNAGSEKATFAVRFANETKEVDIQPTGSADAYDIFDVGTFDIPYPGFYTIRIIPLKKSGDYFPSIKNIHFTATFAGDIQFLTIRDRAAARVILNYAGSDPKASTFYVETTVPSNNDYAGTEVIALGNELMEVGLGNCEKGKYLFVSWKIYNGVPVSRFVSTQFAWQGIDSSSKKITKSIIPYNWSPNKALPLSLFMEIDSCTHETYWDARVYNTQKKKWYSLTKIRVPKGSMAVKEWYSSIINTEAENGYLERKAFFSKPGYWRGNNYSMFNKAVFGYGVKGKFERKDYGAGLENNSYWLSTGGFSYPKANYGQVFTCQSGIWTLPDALADQRPK